MACQGMNSGGCGFQARCLVSQVSSIAILFAPLEVICWPIPLQGPILLPKPTTSCHKQTIVVQPSQVTTCSLEPTAFNERRTLSLAQRGAAPSCCIRTSSLLPYPISDNFVNQRLQASANTSHRGHTAYMGSHRGKLESWPSSWCP